MGVTQKIYDDFHNLSGDDYSGIIRFYENNIVSLDNMTSFRDKEDFEDYILILGQYVISLEKNGKYRKAIQYGDKAIDLIDTKTDEFNIDLGDYSAYWSILTSIGRAQYNLKEYDSAVKAFKKLYDHDPENDNTKIWLDTSRSRKRNWINKYLYILAAIALIAKYSFSDQFNNPKTSAYLTAIALILFVIGLFNEYVIDKILKRQSNI